MVLADAARATPRQARRFHQDAIRAPAPAYAAAGFRRPSTRRRPMPARCRLARGVARDGTAGDARHTAERGVRTCVAPRSTRARHLRHPLRPRRRAVHRGEGGGRRGRPEAGPRATTRWPRPGLIGLACLAADAIDDVHLVSDKIATIQRDRPVGSNGADRQALFHTTLLAGLAEADAERRERRLRGARASGRCGCGALPGRFPTPPPHDPQLREADERGDELSRRRSAQPASRRSCPARFGGGPTDYQLIERRGGRPAHGQPASSGAPSASSTRSRSSRRCSTFLREPRAARSG